MDYQNNQPLAPVKKGNGCAIASLVVGLIAVVFLVISGCIALSSVQGFIAAIGLVTVAIILCVVGVGLGIPGLILGIKRPARKGLAIAAFVINVVLLVVFVILANA